MRKFKSIYVPKDFEGFIEPKGKNVINPKNIFKIDLLDVTDLGYLKNANCLTFADKVKIIRNWCKLKDLILLDLNDNLITVEHIDKAFGGGRNEV